MSYEWINPRSGAISVERWGEATGGLLGDQADEESYARMYGLTSVRVILTPFMADAFSFLRGFRTHLEHNKGSLLL